MNVQLQPAVTRRLRPKRRKRVRAKTLSVVIPALNEAANLGPVLVRLHVVLEDLSREGWKSEILLVDDGSSDRTAGIAMAEGAKVLANPYPIGNGAAVKRGIRNARGECILLLDADGQHPPESIPQLLSHYGKYDLVVGARHGTGHGWHRRLANKVFNTLASYVTSRKIEDLTSGFRCGRAEVFKRYCYLLPNTFSYPTTSTLAFLRGGYSVGYVPIQAAKRKGKSKIKIARDGVRFLVIIAKIATFFAPMRFFGPFALAIASCGCLNYAYTYLTQGRFTNMSVLLVVLGAMTFGLGLISEQITALRFERSEQGPR